METKATLKAWGSSLGVVIPKDIVREEHLKEGEEIVIDIKKKKGLREIFGAMKDLKIDSQKMKDELRRDWAR